MTVPLRFLLPAALVCGLAAGPVTAQEVEGLEVLARGPVHEAFAAGTEQPTGPAAVADRPPPEPIEELPPDQKPAGDNVQWIPGYWQWDEDKTDFIWVSGFWRVPPPGRVWVPGSWREAAGARWQWAPGFWQATAPPQPDQPQQLVQPQIEYLPPPPATIESGPPTPAPSEAHVYVSGTWVWRGRYLWRPGFWVDHRPGWLWVPAHFRWTPCGYVFVEGYWDYPLETRGVLFAPVYFERRVYVQPAFVYTPVYAVPQPALYTSLFVRRGHGCYYFGDYYEPRYATAGFVSWTGVTAGGVAINIGVGVGRRPVYHDPLWNYYRVQHRADPVWAANVNNLYVARYKGEAPRPPRTLVQQNTVINNITRNNTVVNNNVTNVVNNVTMVTQVNNITKTNNQITLQQVPQQARVQEQQVARQIRQVGVERTKLETGLAAKGPAPAAPAAPGQPPSAQPAVQPQTVKLAVPHAAVARAHIQDVKNAPPPPPQKPVSAVVQPPGPGTPTPKFDPKGPKVEPLPTPKIDPKQPPKVDPKVAPKLDPLPTPKIDPKGPPKVDPRPPMPTPKGANPPVPSPNPNPTPAPLPKPKVDPKPPVPEPKGVNPPPLPKVDPKPPANPAPAPKVEPKFTPPVKTDPTPLPKPKVDAVPTPKIPPQPKPPVNPVPAPMPQPKPPVIQPPPKVNGNPPPAPPTPKANPLPVPPPQPVVQPPPPAPKGNPLPAPKGNPQPGGNPNPVPKKDRKD